MSIIHNPYPHGAGSTLTVSGGAGGTASISVANTSWATDNAMQITQNGSLELKGKNADLVIDGQSLKETLAAINRRLAVLQPDPKLLAKYEALQQAYEHYLTLEALLHDNDNS